MKNKDLEFNKNSHTLYSKKCEKEIKKAICSHFKKEECEEAWTKVQLQYVEYLRDWRKDLGDKKNFHNGVGGTYDCIAVLSYYTVHKEKTSFNEIERIVEDLTLPSFRKLWFVDLDKPLWRKLMYKAFCSAKRRCDKWNDYEMNISPYKKGEPIYYEFTKCPVAEFIKQHHLEDIAPALCNVDYPALEAMGARLVRKTTCVNGKRCDYMICGKNDEYLKSHPEYKDEVGWRKNK